jgi:KDO2-lipid IV(A) lauroyltransferase
MRHVLQFLTRLPLPVLYALGRFAYFVAFRVLRWHRELAARNLANAFPEKSEAERAAILKQSYVNLGQTLAETFWGYGASADELTKRVAIENREMINRFGGKPIPIHSFLFEVMRRSGEARAYAMVADQTPPRNMDKYWTRFLNQDTAFFTGADKIARFLDAPVIYVAMRRVRKGHYSVRLHVLVEPPYEGQEVLDVVERYARQLETEIRASPPDWPWVHNKWKYPKPAVEAEPRKRTRARRAA